MMSMFEVYKLKEKAVYPKSDFINLCLGILQDAEATNAEWIEAGVKAPTRQVVLDILGQRTKLTNPYWMQALKKGLGYKSVNELIGNESD